MAVVVADGGREPRRQPRGAHRMVDGLAHAEVADECNGADGVEDLDGRSWLHGNNKK
jgi:hypothetical protein